MFKWFRNLKIGVRIIIGFFIIIAISCATGIVGILNLNNVQDSYALDYKSSVNALERVERISSHFQQVRVNVLGFGMTTDTEYFLERVKNHEGVVDENIKSYHDILDEYDASEVETELKLLKNVEEALATYKNKKDELVANLQNGSITNEEFLSAFSKDGIARQSATDEALKQMVEKFKIRKTSAISHSREELSPEVLKMLEQIGKQEKDKMQKDAIVLTESDY